MMLPHSISQLWWRVSWAQRCATLSTLQMINILLYISNYTEMHTMINLHIAAPMRMHGKNADNGYWTSTHLWREPDGTWPDPSPRYPAKKKWFHASVEKIIWFPFWRIWKGEIMWKFKSPILGRGYFLNLNPSFPKLIATPSIYISTYTSPLSCKSVRYKSKSI